MKDDTFKNFILDQLKPTLKQTLKNYYEVPVDIIEDSGLFTEKKNFAGIILLGSP